MQNLNNDYTYWFMFMSLFNTSIGLNNISKNDEQQKKQEEIEHKIDLILEKLDGRLGNSK